jgi:hypothetical protein
MARLSVLILCSAHSRRIFLPVGSRTNSRFTCFGGVAAEQPQSWPQERSFERCLRRSWLLTNKYPLTPTIANEDNSCQLKFIEDSSCGKNKQADTIHKKRYRVSKSCHVGELKNGPSPAIRFPSHHCDGRHALHCQHIIQHQTNRRKHCE